MKTGAGGRPQTYDTKGRYSGPSGGAVDLRTGEVRVFGAEKGARSGGKLAGADSEEGRNEPKSLLTATRKQLDRIASGTGQAVALGAAGAGQALSRTWEELSTNEELHKGVEFGFKAAGEVSKDVFARAGEDAATAYASAAKARYLSETAGTFARSTGKGLLVNGANDYFGFPDMATDIGVRIKAIKKRTFGQ